MQSISLKVKLLIACIFAILSFVLLSIVAPKASAWNQDNFGSYTPEQIINFCRSAAPNEATTDYYIITYDGGNNRYSAKFFNEGTSITFANSSDYNSYYYSSILLDVTSNGLRENARYYWQTTRLYCNADRYIMQQIYPSSSGNGAQLYPSTESIYNTIGYSIGSDYISPVVLHSDEFYVHANQFDNIEYTVYPGENSFHSGWWSYTRKYKVEFQLTYNNQPIIIPIPSYSSWFMTTRTHRLENVDVLLPDPYSSPVDYMQHIAYVKDLVIDSISSPEFPFSSAWTNTGTEHISKIYLANLLDTVKTQTGDTNLTFSFFKQDFSVVFKGYDDNKTYHTQVLRYSGIDFPEEAPPVPSDPEQPNWLQPLNDVINQINNNKEFNYFNQLPIGYTAAPTPGTITGLEGIDPPEFDFAPVQMDSGAMDFWHQLVNYIYESRLKIVFVAALGFLVLKAVIH